MKQRKIFIAVNLPDYVKKNLETLTKKWQKMPVKWSHKENLHITLQFLGYVDDEKVIEICKIVNQAVKEIEAFEILFTHITLGPNNNQLRLVWVAGNNNLKLKNLIESIEKSLGVFFVPRKDFYPHITLGRVKREKWNNTFSEIQEKINLSVPIETVTIFESVFEGGKRKYLPLENCPLK